MQDLQLCLDVFHIWKTQLKVQFAIPFENSPEYPSICNYFPTLYAMCTKEKGRNAMFRKEFAISNILNCGPNVRKQINAIMRFIRNSGLKNIGIKREI